MKKENVHTVKRLNQLLADYQIHYQNLRGFHWNIKGQLFFALHEKFEEYYNEAAGVVDEIAERILMLGGQPMHTYGDYLKTAKLAEVSKVSNGKKAVEAVLEDQQYFLNSFTEIMENAGEANDEGTVGMISGWIGHTEKRVWMLEAFLE